MKGIVLGIVVALCCNSIGAQAPTETETIPNSSPAAKLTERPKQKIGQGF